MKKWIVEGDEYTNIEDAVQDIIDNGNLTYEFEEHIRDEHGYYTYLEVCDGEWDTIELLSTLGVYENMINDWIQEEKRPAFRRALEQMEVGDKLTLNYSDIECVDDVEKLFTDAHKSIDSIRKLLDDLRPLFYDGGQAYSHNLLIEFVDILNRFIEFVDTAEEKVKRAE